MAPPPPLPPWAAVLGDEGGVVVLDTHAAFASGYKRHTLKPDGFSLPRPYQAPAPEAAAAAAEAEAEPQENSRRKRRRRSGYEPNAKEQAFNARHARVAPLLAAAAAALRAWMAAAGAATLGAALGARAPSGASADAAQPPDAAENAALPADYLAMASLRQALRPKFRWADGGAVGGSGGPAAAGPQRRRSAHPDAAEVDLFGKLVRNDNAQPAAAAGGAEAERLGWACDHQVLIPPGAAFLLSDFGQALRGLTQAAGPQGFACILLDPPWENKSLARGAVALYPSLPAWELARLPLQRLAAPGGCLVAMWVTNREKLRAFVEGTLLPAWGLRHVATWHWLKVTDGGEPVSPLHVAHRRPYESLLLCCAEGAPAPWEGGGGGGGGGGRRPPPHDGAVIVATPAQHSRKPPLADLLQRHLPEGARCLEMFARGLTKGWTSWGNECLKFQGIEHFT